MAASAKEKFDAAVNVIQSLPKNGSFQPSYAMMLTFYGLYKQGSLGPCNISKPGFWDVVGRAKWDAWNRLGSLPKEEAMVRYVDELKKIIETMPHTENVQEFVEKLGDFYELVDDDTTVPHSPVSQMVRNASPKRRNKAATPETHSRDVSPTKLNEYDGVRGRASMRDGDVIQNSYSMTDGREKSSYSSDSAHSINNTGQRVPSSGDLVADSGSDMEEFCDTSDISNLQDDSLLSKNLPLSMNQKLDNRESSDVILQAKLPVDGSKNEAHQQFPLGQMRHIEQTHGAERLQFCASDQLALVLNRLQHDMSSVLVRLQAVETLCLSQKEAIDNNRLAHRKPNKWRLFSSLNYRTIAFLIAWPVVVHLLMQYLTKRRK